MNTLVKAIVLSLSTALVAAPVMAAPQDHQPKKTQFQQHKAPTHQNKHLSKAGKNQHWIKVNGDYILINDKTHSIIKIVRG